MMKPIITLEDSNEVYHSKLDFHSSTRIKLMGKSPLHFKNYAHDLEEADNEDEEKKKETKNILLGSVVHSLVLEPASFDKFYAVSEKFDRRTTKGKEGYEAFSFHNRGKTCIMQPMYDLACKMRDSVLKNKKMVKWINDGIIEESMYFEEEIYFEDGPKLVKQRIRPDIQYQREDFMIDLKTCADASPEGAAKSAVKYDYPLSAVHYTNGVNICKDRITRLFIICFVESVPPYGCMLYPIEEEDMEKQRRVREGYIRRIAECEKTGIWPGYESNPKAVNGMQYLKLPAYYFTKN